MSWSAIQATQQGSANSSSTRTLPFSSNVTAGNLLVVAIGAWSGSIPSFTVTDSQGNSYSQVVYERNGNPSCAIFVAIASADGANTVSVTPSAASYMGIGIAEYSGNAPSSLADGTGTHMGTGTSLDTSSIAVNASGELFLGVFSHGSGTFTFTADAPFNLRCNQPNGSTNAAVFLIDDFPVSSATNGTGSLSSSATWVSAGATIKGLSGGPWPWFFDNSMSGGLSSLGGM